MAKSRAILISSHMQAPPYESIV